MKATIRQYRYTFSNTYGPFEVTLDESGDLSFEESCRITKLARESGAVVGYCDVIVTDETGKVAVDEIAVV